MVLIGAICGVGVGAGLILIVLGLRGTPVPNEIVRSQDRHVAHWVRRVAIAAVAALAAVVITGWPVAGLLAGAAAFVVPDTLRRQREAEASVVRTEAVAGWTEMLRDTLAGAAGLEEAILATGTTAPEPIRPQVQQLGRRLQHAPATDALYRFADDLANPASDLVAAALVTAVQREARELVELLSALAASTRAEADMRRRVHAGRARIRTASRVVLVTLALFAGGLVVFNRDYLEPYSTPVGQAVLLVVGLIFAGGWWLMQRMGRLPEPERVLTRRPLEIR